MKLGDVFHNFFNEFLREFCYVPREVYLDTVSFKNLKGALVIEDSAILLEVTQSFLVELLKVMV